MLDFPKVRKIDTVGVFECVPEAVVDAGLVPAAEFGARGAGIGDGRSLKIDPTNGHILDDSEAAKLWTCEYEPSWEATVCPAKKTANRNMKANIRQPRIGALALAILLGVFTSAFAQKEETNILTDVQKAEGWTLLWDGKTNEGWRSPKSDSFPTTGWLMSDGVLSIMENKGGEAAGGGDIITRKRYSDFELKVDFKITTGANSGVKIFVQPNIAPISKAGEPAAVGSAIGMEFQILDDKVHPDAKLGHNGDRTIGSLYDLIPAPLDKNVKPIGEWNEAHILSQGKHVTFWLNGVKTVEFDRGSEDFRARVAASKYHNIPGFGEWADGHIMLQEHGNQVFYRNVILREFGKK